MATKTYMIFILSIMGSSCIHSKKHFAGNNFEEESTAWVLVRGTVLGHSEPSLRCAFVQVVNALQVDGPWIHGFYRVRAPLTLRYNEGASL